MVFETVLTDIPHQLLQFRNLDDGTAAAKIVEEENLIIWRGGTYAQVREMRKSNAYGRAQLSLVGS